MNYLKKNKNNQLFKMADIAEQAEQQEALARKIAHDNRVRFTEWDGLSRECENCLDLINPERLKAINAKLCISCADREEKRR